MAAGRAATGRHLADRLDRRRSSSVPPTRGDGAPRRPTPTRTARQTAIGPSVPARSPPRARRSAPGTFAVLPLSRTRAHRLRVETFQTRPGGRRRRRRPGRRSGRRRAGRSGPVPGRRR
ncbi:hypothetical protein NKH77_12515 [Streptomyces sp. M19]